MRQSFLYKRETTLLILLAGVVAGAAFLCAAHYDFSRPVLGTISFAAIFSCFITLLLKADLNLSYGFRDIVAVIGMIAVGATVGEAFWLAYFAV